MSGLLGTMTVDGIEGNLYEGGYWLREIIGRCTTPAGIDIELCLNADGKLLIRYPTDDKDLYFALDYVSLVKAVVEAIDAGPELKT